jgi:hypothetical protein
LSKENKVEQESPTESKENKADEKSPDESKHNNSASGAWRGMDGE